MGTARKSKTAQAVGELTSKLTKLRQLERATKTLKQTIGADLAEANKRITVLGEAAHNWRNKYNAAEQSNSALNEALVQTQEELRTQRALLSAAEDTSDFLRDQRNLLRQERGEVVASYSRRLRTAKLLGLALAGIAIGQALARIFEQYGLL